MYDFNEKIKAFDESNRIKLFKYLIDVKFG